MSAAVPEFKTSATVNSANGSGEKMQNNLFNQDAGTLPRFKPGSQLFSSARINKCKALPFRQRASAT
jgi:hypothetical protein